MLAIRITGDTTMSIAEQIVKEALDRNLPLDEKPEMARELKCLEFLQDIPDSLCMIASEAFKHHSKRNLLYSDRGINA